MSTYSTYSIHYICSCSSTSLCVGLQMQTLSGTRPSLGRKVCIHRTKKSMRVVAILAKGTGALSTQGDAAGCGPDAERCCAQASDVLRPARHRPPCRGRWDRRARRPLQDGPPAGQWGPPDLPPGRGTHGWRGGSQPPEPTVLPRGPSRLMPHVASRRWPPRPFVGTGLVPELLLVGPWNASCKGTS